MNLVKDLKINATSLQELTDTLGIKIKEYSETTYDDGSVCQKRYVLNYDQIESPKSHPYVMQSRGLILDADFNVLCLPFDRFFNFGEVVNHSEIIDWSKAFVQEKVDGSLIKIYWDGRQYCIATRGTAFAESNVGGWDLTFKDLVLKALNMTNEEFQVKCLFNLSFDHTYLCEITAMENRVVTPYKGYTLWHLATRHNISGEYLDSDGILKIGAVKPKEYTFETSEDCLRVASELPDLQEGYVVYQDGTPTCKIKSPAYVAVHHIKSEGLNPKRIAQLVLANEQGEYLTYFGEDYQHIEPYEIAFHRLKCEMVDVYNQFKDLESQKDFALSVKDYPYQSILFKARGSNGNVIEAFDSMAINFKIQLLEKFKIE